MHLTIHPLRDTATRAVSYVVACERHCAIIDPLVGGDLILELVEANDYVADWILVTHDDPDLWPTVQQLRKCLPCVRLGGLAGLPATANLDRCLADQERFSLGSWPVHVEVLSRAGDAQAGYVVDDCMFVGSRQSRGSCRASRTFASGRYDAAVH